jgi:hypothetical protein
MRLIPYYYLVLVSTPIPRWSVVSYRTAARARRKKNKTTTSRERRGDLRLSLMPNRGCPWQGMAGVLQQQHNRYSTTLSIDVIPYKKCYARQSTKKKQKKI